MSLILNSVETVRSKLNDFMGNQYPKDDDWVVLSNPFDERGEREKIAGNRIAMSVVNISHETTVSTVHSTRPTNTAGMIEAAPPLYVNLHVLFYANFSGKQYHVALDAISSTISFFQQNPVFHQDNSPTLDRQIDKLSFEFSNLDFAEMSQLMGMIGATYLPSVVYKVRLIPFTDNSVAGDIPLVQDVNKN